MANESFGKIGRRYPATPAAKNDHAGPGIARRAFLRMSGGAAWVSTLAGAFYAERLFRNEETKDREREALELLDQLLGCNREKVPLATVPAVNHPNVRGTKQYFSQSGEEVSGHYFRALRQAGCHVRPASGAIRLHHADTVVVIGSRLANTYAEKYLGTANALPDALQVLRDNRGARVRPKWTFYSDPATEGVEVVQWEKPWLSRSSVIVDCTSTDRVFSSPERLHPASGKKYRDGDYLLVTVVPRYGRDDPQRVIVFEGLHRNGTRAAGLICEEPPLEDLRKIAKAVSANPYYQALFSVETSVDSKGEAKPLRVRLREEPFPLAFRS